MQGVKKCDAKGGNRGSNTSDTCNIFHQSTMDKQWVDIQEWIRRRKARKAKIEVVEKVMT